MNKYKICVYAISKNEEKYVKKWVESMKEADSIYVLDTGSTDNTVNLLKECGVNVTIKEIKPWRFDTARNLSLDLVPEDTDICVCTDLDEIFLPGWRKKLEDSWEEYTTKARYNYNWSLDKNDKPLVNFYTEKMHSRKDYKWTHPVHEILTYIGNAKEKCVTINDITLNHYPDRNKSRSSYLPLLELSVKEDPLDDRNMHYLGREYMYYGMWNEAIDTLIKHLSLEKSVWKDERCASMRFIGRCYKELGRYEEAKMWFNKAILEAPYLRDPYAEMAMLMYSLNDWDNVIKYSLDAIKIEYNPKTYINEVISYDESLYDLLAIAYFYKNNLDLSYKYVNMALEINPDNNRIKNNSKIIFNEMKKEEN